jgi:C4-dicarboxylate-binding protein DctP
MKIRAIGPVESAFTKQIGAVPVPVNWVELYTALAQGIVDGNWAADLAQFATKFHENTNFTLDPKTGGLGIFVVINNKALANLPSGVRSAFVKTWPGHTQRMRDASRKAANIGRMLIVKKGGHKVTNIHPADRERMVRIAKPLVDKWAKSLDADSRRIFMLAKGMIDKHNAGG